VIKLFKDPDYDYELDKPDYEDELDESDYDSEYVFQWHEVVETLSKEYVNYLYTYQESSKNDFRNRRGLIFLIKKLEEIRYDYFGNIHNIIKNMYLVIKREVKQPYLTFSKQDFFLLGLLIDDQGKKVSYGTAKRILDSDEYKYLVAELLDAGSYYLVLDLLKRILRKGYNHLLKLEREYLLSTIQYDSFIEERMEFLVNFETGDDVDFDYDAITETETIFNVKPIHLFTYKNIVNYLYLLENVKEDDISSNERVEFLLRLSKEYEAPLAATMVLDKIKPKEVVEKKKSKADRENIITNLKNGNYKKHPYYEEFSKFITQNLISIKKNPYLREYNQQELAEQVDWLDKKESNLKAKNLFTKLREVSDDRAFVYEAFEILQGANKLGIDTSGLSSSDVIRIIFGKSVHELGNPTVAKLAHSLLDAFIGKK
jgi:hypothetical protein